MQALNTLAVVYATFEQALHADVRAAVEEFNEAQQNQERMRGELKVSQESLDIAIMDVQETTSKLKDCRGLHSAAYQSLEDAGKRTTETKRKADDTQDQIRAHWDRCRRATEEFVTAEEDLHDCLGRVGQLVTDSAGATHALSCGVPDRDSNEVCYLQEALDMIEDVQIWWSVKESSLAEDEVGRKQAGIHCGVRVR